MSDPNTPAPTIPLGEALEAAKLQERKLLQEAAAKALQLPTDSLHAHDAERGVLCAVLLDGDKYDEAVSKGLHPEDFHHPEHALLFRVMGVLRQSGRPMDFVTLTEQLKRDGRLDAAGGMNLLAHLESLLPTTEHVDAYIRLVQDKALLRRLVEVSRQAVQWVFQPNADASEVIDRVGKAVLSIRRESARKGIATAHELAVRAMKHYAFLFHEKTPVTGISTGFGEFDQLTFGLQPGELVVIAARPSMGKTALALNIAAQVTVRQNIPLVFFSLEMSAEQLFSRLIAAEARLDLSSLRRGYIRGGEYAALTEMVGKVERAPLYIDEAAILSVAQLRSKARYLLGRHGVRVIVVDYLQLLHSTNSYDNKAAEVGEISKGLKTLAREFNVPVIALSQLNRGVESRTDKRPMMSDLRESGAIEQDADVVALLYREEYYLRDRTPQELEGIAEVIIAKNRNGPTGSFKLRFASRITRFDNLATEEFGGRAV